MNKNKTHNRHFFHTTVNVLIIALIAAIYLFMQNPSETLAVVSPHVIYRGQAEHSVAIQFTLDWNAVALDDILDTLSLKDVHASFFVSGSWAEQNKATLKKIVDAGHEIGTMGYLPDQDGDRDWLIADISRSLDIIRKETGIDCTLYYCGSRDIKNSSNAASALGLKNVRCSVDLLCARGDSRDIIERVPPSVRGGAILLMSPTGQAKDALPHIIDTLLNRGFRVTSTGNVLY